MNGFFARLARRALGETEGVRPRMPLRFEAEGAIAALEPPPSNSWTGRVPAGASHEASGIRPAPQPLFEAPTRSTGPLKDRWDASHDRPRAMTGLGPREPASTAGQTPSDANAPRPSASADVVASPNIAAGGPRASRSSGRAPPTVSRQPPPADSRASALLPVASDDEAMVDRAAPPRALERAAVRQRAAEPMAPRPRADFLDRADAEPPLRAAAEAPTVQVTIGTIEVRATVEPPKRVVPPRGPAKPRVPLDEYLRRRGGSAPR